MSFYHLLSKKAIPDPDFNQDVTLYWLWDLEEDTLSGPQFLTWRLDLVIFKSLSAISACDFILGIDSAFAKCTAYF